MASKVVNKQAKQLGGFTRYGAVHDHDEDRLRRELHGEGYTVREMAEELGLSKVVIYQWHRRRGLPYNR